MSPVSDDSAIKWKKSGFLKGPRATRPSVECNLNETYICTVWSHTDFRVLSSQHSQIHHWDLTSHQHSCVNSERPAISMCKIKLIRCPSFPILSHWNLPNSNPSCIIGSFLPFISNIQSLAKSHQFFLHSTLGFTLLSPFQRCRYNRDHQHLHLVIITLPNRSPCTQFLSVALYPFASARLNLKHQFYSATHLLKYDFGCPWQALVSKILHSGCPP